MKKRKTFFQKVCQFVKVKASPKQPQSVTGFRIARIRVRGVKTNINNQAPQAAPFILIFKKRHIPIKNSRPDRRKEKKRAEAFRPPNPKALKYSINLYSDPSGSIPFTKPEPINTRPKSIRKRLAINFISVSFYRM